MNFFVLYAAVIFLLDRWMIRKQYFGSSTDLFSLMLWFSVLLIGISTFVGKYFV